IATDVVEIPPLASGALIGTAVAAPSGGSTTNSAGSRSSVRPQPVGAGVIESADRGRNRAPSPAGHGASLKQNGNRAAPPAVRITGNTTTVSVARRAPHGRNSDAGKVARRSRAASVALSITRQVASSATS